MTEPISKRIVPGAPPPAPPSKSQLKRQRKKAKAGDATPSQTQSPAVTNVAIPDSTSAALVEQAPAKEDVQQGAVAEELVANGTNGTPRESPGEVPATSSAPVESPIVDIIHKRIKAANKKIVRVFPSRVRLCGVENPVVFQRTECKDTRPRTLRNLMMISEGL